MCNDELPTACRIVMTGWHVMTPSDDLKDGFKMTDIDVMPIDAPSWIAAGSTVRSASGAITGSIVHGRWLTMFK